MTGLDIAKRMLTSSATVTVADVSRNQNGRSSCQNQGSVDLDKIRVLRQSSKVNFELCHPTPIQDHARDD